MKRFQFSLQTVHNIREMKREEAERAFALVATELGRAREQLETVLRRRKSAMDKYVLSHQSDQLEAATCASHTDYLGSLLLLERQARATTLQIEEKIVSKRQALTEASRQTETTANLRERQRERHHLISAQHEQKVLDEMAVAAVARRLATNK